MVRLQWRSAAPHDPMPGELYMGIRPRDLEVNQTAEQEYVKYLCKSPSRKC